MRWFRFYSEVLDDPKVQRLPPKLYCQWTKILCLANTGNPRGVLPSVADIAYRLRITEEKAHDVVGELVARMLIDRNGDGVMKPHNWDARQPASDNAPERMRKKRRTSPEPNTKAD